MFDGRIISGITVFVAVAEAGSYTRAAAEIGLSRSGVGKAIARLEERTGMRLFDRTSRALKLTDEGRSFLEEVAPLLERLGAAAAPARPDALRGHLRVSCDAAFGTHLLMAALSSFTALHPRLRIDMLIRDRMDNLAAENFDMSVRFGELDSAGLDRQRLMASRIVTCASRDYVHRHRTPETPDDLLDGFPCIRQICPINSKPQAWRFVDGSGASRIVDPPCHVAVNDLPSVMAGILSGLGVGRVLEHMVARELRAGHVVELIPDWNRRKWPAHIYVPPRAYQSAAVEAFGNFLHSYPFEHEEALGVGR